jgi:ADP-heptose:LPS heptosyltransferase
MGYGINKLRTELREKIKNDPNVNVVVIIMTDGEENSSRQWGAIHLKALIEQLEDSNSWTVTFLGANQDSILTAETLGINRGNSISYHSTGKGTMSAYKTLNKAASVRAAGMSSHAEAFATMDSADYSNAKGLLNRSFIGNVAGDSTIIAKDEDETEK